MKAKLIFKLPEEEHEFELASKSSDLLCAVTDFNQWMRNRLKHSEISADAGEELEYVYQKLHEFIEDYHIKHLLDY